MTRSCVQLVCLECYSRKKVNKKEKEREGGKAKTVSGFIWRMFLWAVGLSSARN